MYGQFYDEQDKLENIFVFVSAISHQNKAIAMFPMRLCRRQYNYSCITVYDVIL